MAAKLKASFSDLIWLRGGGNERRCLEDGAEGSPRWSGVSIFGRVAVFGTVAA